MKTVVLLSGGLDSATVLALLDKEIFDSGRAVYRPRDARDYVLAVGFDYGQPHKIELEYAAKLANHYEVPFLVRTLPEMPLVDDVVFAGRNLVFASHAIAVAQSRKFDSVALGCNKNDWERFPDCRPQFLDALTQCAEAYGIKVRAPFLHSTKDEVAKSAKELGVPIEKTWSCYTPQQATFPIDHIRQCGSCLACKTREDALRC